MRHKQLIRLWFEREKKSGLILPDGWYGRPYDNLYELESIEESGADISICLVPLLELHFTSVGCVQFRDRDLVISNFSKLRFKWIGVGTSEGSRTYFSGEVKLVSSRVY